MKLVPKLIRCAAGLLFAVALAAFPATALATPRETATFTSVDSNGILNAPTNSVLTRSLVGGYALGRIDFSGTLTTVSTRTWSSDARLLITAPSGETNTFAPFNSGGTFSSRTISGSMYMPASALVPGDWTFRFYELVDDNGTGVDARWTMTVTFTDEPPPPPAATDLGSLTSPGPSTQTQSLGVGQVRWYKFTVPCGVRRSRGQYVDITTTGSVIAGGAGNGGNPDDTQIALFSSSGLFLTSNDDDGAGFLAQLSFGTGSGQLPPTGSDAEPLNGSDGALAPGTYYLAVGAYRLEFGAGRWQITALSAQSGTISVTIRNNLALPTAPCPCAADVNGASGVSVQDIFDFLALYFSGSSEADFNSSGAVSVQDIFDFLAAYFAGC